MLLSRCWFVFASTASITLQQRTCTALSIESSPRPTVRSRGGWDLRCSRRASTPGDGSSRTTPAPTSSRRRILAAIASIPLSQWVVGYAVDPSFTNRALAAVPAINNKAAVVLKSPNDTLGLELFETTIGSPPQSVLAIARILSPKRFSPTSAATAPLRPGMVCRTYTLQSLKDRVQRGPYPIEIEFENLALGGDAVNDFGRSMVTSQDALTLAQEQARQERGAGRSGSSLSSSSLSGLQVTVLRQGDAADCRNIQSRRGDVLEIRYEASRLKTEGGGDSDTNSPTTRKVVYDSSDARGTGQPYQMVLGSGDMLSGVDLGLYDMCPGESRRIEIPAALAYGARGNKLFQIPPGSNLAWTVDLVLINAVRPRDGRSREEVEGRFAYQ
jgi:FKBP-type peptidyl-prolyl cis-trans isomerase